MYASDRASTHRYESRHKPSKGTLRIANVANLLPNIPNNVAVSILKREHAKLDAERTQLVIEITERQRRIDQIDARLREVAEGERVLSDHDNQ